MPYQEPVTTPIPGPAALTCERGWQAFNAGFSSQLNATINNRGLWTKTVKVVTPPEVILPYHLAYNDLLRLGYPEDSDTVNRTTGATHQLANAMAAWASYRLTKTVYHFERKLSQALLHAPWPKGLPTQALFLPRNGMVIRVHNRDLRQIDLGFDGNGADEWLDICCFYDFTYGEAYTWQHANLKELSFSILHANGTVNNLGSFPLTEGTLAEVLAIDGMLMRAKHAGYTTEHYSQEDIDSIIEIARRLFVALCNHILYINGNDDIVKLVHPGEKPITGKSPKARAKKRDAAPPVLYQVGKEYASIVERWETEHATEEMGPDGERRTVRPHVRAAHSHLYWTGPRNGIVGIDRLPRVHFLPPILVRGGDGGSERAPTLRRVK